MYALAVIPAIILLIIVWKYDTVEKEPPALIAKLFFGGALTVISAVVTGRLGDSLLGLFYKGEMPLFFVFIDSLIFTAFAQEAGKYLVLRAVTWKNREFNYTFDAVVYAVAVSLGFSVTENIVYIIRSGAAASPGRIFLTVPGHVLFAVFMGFFYGLARYAKGVGDEKAERKHTAEALLVPAAMNGFYAFCFRADKPVFFVLLVIYEVIITVITVKKFFRLSKEDMFIPGMEWTVSEDKGIWEDGRNEGKM